MVGSNTTENPPRLVGSGREPAVSVVRSTVLLPAMENVMISPAEILWPEEVNPASEIWGPVCAFAPNARLTSTGCARYRSNRAPRNVQTQGRGSQVVRQRSAKPLFGGSIPPRASNGLASVRQ